jgi:hypothetical protein
MNDGAISVGCDPGACEDGLPYLLSQVMIGSRGFIFISEQIRSCRGATSTPFFEIRQANTVLVDPIHRKIDEITKFTLAVSAGKFVAGPDASLPTFHSNSSPQQPPTENCRCTHSPFPIFSPSPGDREHGTTVSRQQLRHPCCQTAAHCSSMQCLSPAQIQVCDSSHWPIRPSVVNWYAR